MGFDAITDEKYHCMHKYTHPLQVPNRTMVGREKEMKQIRAAMNRPELCNVLLLGEAGSGKALSNDTLIPVVDDRKYVCIKDIKVGDYVFDEASDPTRVLGVYPQGFIHAYEMKFSNGATIICNEEHLWQASLNKSDWGVCTLFDMMAAGIVDEAGNPQWSVPLGAVGQVDVVSVVDLHDDMEMTCLYVEADSHLFQVTESRIVTHNTMLVQSTMQNDRGKLYLEVDLSRMVANCSTDVNQMAAKLKSLFDEVSRYVKEEHEEVVLFMDEFHQVVQLSDAAVEALKPLLADSGVRGIRVITATTPVEFRRHISPNQPLVERLQRINLSQTDKETTISILKGMAARYGVADQIYNDAIYESIYEYTNRYIPANAQPRKSILIMDAMIGWHRAEGRKIDKYLLADVIYESEGVNVAFKVDASKIKARLDKKVLSQKFATQVIEQRLQLCVADLNNKSRPMSSFLFSGSSGSGKTEMVKSLAEILFDDDRSLLRFDCTEFANADSLERFRRELTARAWEHPHSIILLDEIEKACSPVTRLLLQVLDDGRLIDENNREVSFINAYIVMTTNAGSEIYRTIAQYAADDDGSGKSMSRYDKLIRNSISTTTGDNRFPPELLGRIDCIVPFQPLSEETMKAIARMKLQQMRRDILQRHGIKVLIQQNVIRYLVEDNLDTDSDSGGARTVVSKMESEVTTKIAKFINNNPGVYKVRVSVEGTLAADDVTKLLSDAYIKVEAAM